MQPYRQWVCWRLEPDPKRPDKPRKVPYNSATGQRASSTDPATWADYQTAVDRMNDYNGIGFVFTEADPFVFVDLDDCRDPATGAYTDHAEQVWNNLPGAWEVSQSGKGLHGVGLADMARLAGKRNKWTDASGHKHEVYATGRFMAIGGGGWRGAPSIDWTESLVAWVPDGGPANDTDGPEWIDAARPDYDGPADNDDLIRRARASRGLSNFGHTASFEQLWTADPALGEFWSDDGGQGRTFDHSSADLALANALAWWTGCNPVRMLSLFKQSALWRDDERKARMAIAKAVADPERAYMKGKENDPANDEAPTHKQITATPYSWRDPRTIPPRPWMLGRWALMGEVTTILAPGGTGKSTLGAGVGLSLATARALLGQEVYDGPHAVWLLNLEDGIEELERQVGAATIKHNIDREECGDRLFLDSGIVQPLCTATETRDGFTIDEPTFEHLGATIHQWRIRAVVVDPFISSHTVSEASNEAIDAIVKRWKRLAQETGCAVVLVHHTKKLGGREATAEDGRGAVALRDASRVVLALNPMTEADGKKLGVFDPTVRGSIVRVDMGKANRAPAERASWFKIEGQCLGNATPSRPADNVGVAVEWKRPDLLHGFTSDHLCALQERLGVSAMRENVQATDWVGKAIAEIAGLDLENEEHKARIKAVLAAWIDDGSLAIDHRDNGKGSVSPFVVCGRSVDAIPGQMDPR